MTIVYNKLNFFSLVQSITKMKKKRNRNEKTLFYRRMPANNDRVNDKINVLQSPV